MDFTCYLHHDSSFEPEDCANFFLEKGYKVGILSDFSDDSLKITIQEAGKNYHFQSNKMDRASYKKMLENHADYAQALKNYNAEAEISSTNIRENTLIITLLEYLQRQHKAKIFQEFNKQPLSQKRLEELREQQIQNTDKQKFSLKKIFTHKYFFKILVSVLLVVGYLIFDSRVSYSTNIFFFIIVLGVIVLWVHS